jgi:hypothetical protein
MVVRREGALAGAEPGQRRFGVDAVALPVDDRFDDLVDLNEDTEQTTPIIR